MGFPFSAIYFLATNLKDGKLNSKMVHWNTKNVPSQTRRFRDIQISPYCGFTRDHFIVWSHFNVAGTGCLDRVSNSRCVVCCFVNSYTLQIGGNGHIGNNGASLSYTCSSNKCHYLRLYRNKIYSMMYEWSVWGWAGQTNLLVVFHWWWLCGWADYWFLKK